MIKKLTLFILIIGIIFMLVTDSGITYAEELYPLEAGEKLIQENVIDENHVGIVTQINNEMYFKKLQQNEGKWIIESEKVLKPQWTGFRINETAGKGDRKLAKALTNELKSFGLETTSLPSIVDYSNSPFLPPVGRQYENSCVGWATGYYLRTYQQARDIGWPVKATGSLVANHTFSPSFIYNQIRQDTVKEDYEGGGGAFISDASNLLAGTGAATLADFPYIPGEYKTPPDETVLLKAHPHRISTSTLLFSDQDTDQDIIQRTREYLNTGDLLIAGSRIGLKFEYNELHYVDAYGNHIITNETDTPFMHAYVIVGYNDTIYTPDGMGAFKLINSWGPSWGNAGFCYISYKAFAANVLEGYVFTDYLNSDTQDFPVDTRDDVVFNMTFSGQGKYDIQIKNSSDLLVYEENDLQGVNGANSYTWNGKDMTGISAADGPYRLSVIPYYNNTPQTAYTTTFQKLGKIQSVNAYACSYEGVINYVEVPITFKADGILNIKIEYRGTVHNVISNQAVTAGDAEVYRIPKDTFDFNIIDLDQVKLTVDVQ